MKFKKAAIVGCGGIAVNLAPGLSRLMDVVLIDGDKYEPKNVTRQFPAMHSAANKAETLALMLRPNTTMGITSIPEFIKDSMILNDSRFEGVDLIIGCVDNNSSRLILMDLADEMDATCILAGNEHEDGEAHCFIPGVHNPLEHFEFPEGERTPWGCNTDEVIEKYPQTPLANIMAASAVFHILLSLEKVKKPTNAVVHSRLEPLSSTFKRAKHFEEKAPAPVMKE
jgi:molybdopterin/thiamine biosynthesis adenylyltransferase